MEEEEIREKKEEPEEGQEPDITNVPTQIIEQDEEDIREKVEEEDNQEGNKGRMETEDKGDEGAQENLFKIVGEAEPSGERQGEADPEDTADFEPNKTKKIRTEGDTGFVGSEEGENREKQEEPTGGDTQGEEGHPRDINRFFS